MTPKELNLCVEAYAERRKVMQEHDITMTWLGEYFHRVKKLPKLDDFIKKPKQEMSGMDMKEMAKRLNAKFKGKEEAKK